MQSIDANEAIRRLKEPLRFEFGGKEKDFEEYVFENICDICENLHLPKIVVSERQRVITLEDIQIRIDIILRHSDDSITIVEVKKINSKNPQSGHYAQVCAIGQLLLYKTVVKAFTGCEEIRLLLIDNKIYYRTRCAFIEEKLPITLMEIQQGEVFIPYFGW